ncbi:MAG: TIGR02391 family protein [Balneola sp.]
MAKAVRRITANTKALISELVEILYPFLPLSSRSKTAVTFISIFKESKVEKYLGNSSYKKAQLQNGFESLFRYHKKLPFTIIRKLVPAAIDYRKFKRDPLKQEELNSLIEILMKLEIDMREELGSIVLDENVPEIQVPPEELVKRLENHPLVPEISSEPLQQFKNGHFNESVRKATERFEVEVQLKSDSTDIGKQLMARTFALPTPPVALNTLSTENEKGIQEGYKFMTMGMILAIRNIFSHGDEEQRSPEETYEMLLFMNWLFRILKNE